MTTHELAKRLLDMPKDLQVFIYDDGDATSEITVRFETHGVFIETFYDELETRLTPPPSFKMQ